MDRRANLIREIKNQLAIYAVRVDMDKGEASRAAENFYCDLLNILLGCNLQNMNRDHPNFPAIDLGENSENRKLGVQVTSTTTRQKVQDTLDTFFRHGLEKTYTQLVMLIVGKWTESRKSFRMNGTLDFDPNRDIWDTDWLVTKIEAIQDVEHLERIMDLLKKHIDLAQPQPAPLDLPLRTAMNEDNFVGRESELAEIAKRFDRNERIVVLSGLGGMGKTELAVRFGRDYANSGAGRAYFVNFRKDFFRTVTDEIALGIEGLTEQKLDEEAKFKAAMAVLRKCGKDDLLILDNADTEEGSFEQLKREASVLPLRILITTRCDAVGAIDVDSLHREELHRIFRLYVDSISEADMDALIDAVDAHTLTVDLMARSLRPGRRAATPEKLLTALNKRDLTSESFMKVATSYPGGLKQARINEHLRVVFKVAELEEPEQLLLCCATLLPNGGMDDKLFMMPFVEKMQEVLDALIQKGWLLWEDDLLHIHPVIRIVCKEELKPTDENCEAFLERISANYDGKQYDKDQFSQLAELFTCASDDLEDQYGKWALRAGFFWHKLGEVRKALKYNLRMVEQGEKYQLDSEYLASAYNNTGSTYSSLGEHEKALVYKQKSLEIREQDSTVEQMSLATSYNNMGSTYDDLGKHDKALEYKLKALAIVEKECLPRDPILAAAYNNVGITYGELGKHELALEYQQKALVIWDQVPLPDHPDLALVYNNIGGTYMVVGDYENALTYMLKALSIQNVKLPADHSRNVACCGNISLNYAMMNDFSHASEYADKALEKAERSMQGHPDLKYYQQAAQAMRHYASLQEQGIPFDNPFKEQ